MRKVRAYNPHAGGKKIPPASQERIRHRILAHAEKNYSGKFHKIDVRFKNQFCYIDAYREPVVFEPHNEKLFGPREQYIEALRSSPTHLVRLRFFGDEEAWSLAFYTYSNEKYEPCAFENGSWTGTPEQAFDIGSVYLD
jgi:hypothetical protein